MTKLTLKPTTTLSAATQAKLTALLADTVKQTGKQASSGLVKSKPQSKNKHNANKGSLSSPSQAKTSSLKQQRVEALGPGQDKAQSSPSHNNKIKRPYPTREEQAAMKERIQAAQTWFTETYPAVFTRDTPKPLKLGVKAELLTQRSSSLSYHQLTDALKAWTRRRTYLQTILDHDQRYNLQGEPVEDITPEHKEHARTQLALKQQRYEIRQQRIVKHKEHKLSQQMRDKSEDNIAVTSSSPDESS